MPLETLEDLACHIYYKKGIQWIHLGFDGNESTFLAYIRRRAVHTEHAHSSQQQNLLNSSRPTRPRHKMLFSKPCSISASHPLMVLLPLLFIVVAMLSSNSVSATGMPPKMECCQPAMMSCCAAPAMQSCGCGRRKKREAVQPHIKGNETPCPQTEWRQLMQNAIVPLDDIESVNSVQTALMRRFPDNKFLVMCALAGDEIRRPADSKQMLPNEVHLSSSGNGYCNVVSERIWCQAAAVVA